MVWYFILYSVVLVILMFFRTAFILNSVAQLTCIASIIYVGTLIYQKKIKLNSQFRSLPLALLGLSFPILFYFLFFDWKYQQEFYLNLFFYIQIIYYFFMIALPEEIFFRHLLLKKGDKITMYCFMSALMFGLMHFSQGLGAIAYYSCFGLLYAWLRIQGVSVLFLILSHTVYNLVVGDILVAQSSFANNLAFVFIASLGLLSTIATLSIYRFNCKTSYSNW